MSAAGFLHEEAPGNLGDEMSRASSFLPVHSACVVSLYFQPGSTAVHLYPTSQTAFSLISKVTDSFLFALVSSPRKTERKKKRCESASRCREGHRTPTQVYKFSPKSSPPSCSPGLGEAEPGAHIPTASPSPRPRAAVSPATPG